MSSRPSAAASIYSIQYLRAIAALAVLVDHALNIPVNNQLSVLINFGRLGVEVFFVISGFIITVIGGAGPFNPITFLRRRIERIVPIYWAATFVVTIAALLLPNLFKTTVVTWEGLIKSLVFIPSEVPKAPLLTLGWTLNFEAFFYVAFAFLFFLSSERRTLVLCGVLGLMVLFGQIADPQNAVLKVYTSPSLIGFCAGALLAQAWRHGLIQRMGALGRWATSVAGILLSAWYLTAPATSELPIGTHFVLTGAGLSIVMLGLQVEAAGLMPKFAPLKLLGDASYSIYLFHYFAVGLLWAVMKSAAASSALVFGLGVILTLAAGIAAGLAVYFLLEKPMMTMFQRRRHGLAASVAPRTAV